jgi:hypothetical protein
MTQSSPHISKWIDTFKPSPKFLLALAGMGLPAGYIAFRHIDWKKKPDARKRMWITQAIFWPMAAFGLRVMHMALWRYKESPWKMGGGILLGAGIVSAGFEGSMRLAQQLVPKKTVAPLTPSNDPVALRQAYQQGIIEGYRLAQQQMLNSTAGRPVPQPFPLATAYRPALFR